MTKLQNKVIELYQQGLQLKFIQEATGVKPDAVCRIVTKAGIKLRYKKGPFYRICATCGDVKQVEGYKDSTYKRCKRHQHVV